MHAPMEQYNTTTGNQLMPSPLRLINNLYTQHPKLSYAFNPMGGGSLETWQL